MDLDATAERLQRRVYRMVLAAPQDRAKIVGTTVRRLRPAAINAGAASMEPTSAIRRRLDRLLGAVPPRDTVEQHDARAFQRRLDLLRANGVEVVQNDQGQWYRKTAKGKLIRVETDGELVQRRVARAERLAVVSARQYAKRLGVKGPPARGRPQWDKLDPRLSELYARRVAMESSRIAHDALVDTYRDAALDRAEQLGVGWVRHCERDACGACLALANGEVHPPSDRRFYRHTRCRCRPVPARGKLPATGRAIFESLTTREQDALFHGRGGAAKAEALRDGRIELADLVQVAQDRTTWTDYVIGETPLEALPAAPN